MRKHLVAICLTLLLCAPARALVIEDDHGGTLGDSIARYAPLASTTEKVEIRGDCLGGCTVALAFVKSSRVCVGPRARLGFQAAWKKGRGGRKVIDEAATFELQRYQTPAIREWVRRHGGFTLKPIFLAGDELAKFFEKCE